MIRNGSPVEVLVIRAVRSPNLWCVPRCVSRNASVRGIDQFGGKACVSPGRTAQVRHGSKRIPIFPTARIGFSRPQACGFEKPSLAVGKMQTPYAGSLLSINLLWGTNCRRQNLTSENRSPHWKCKKSFFLIYIKYISALQGLNYTYSMGGNGSIPLFFIWCGNGEIIMRLAKMLTLKTLVLLYCFHCISHSFDAGIANCSFQLQMTKNIYIYWKYNRLNWIIWLAEHLPQTIFSISVTYIFCSLEIVYIRVCQDKSLSANRVYNRF